MLNRAPVLSALVFATLGACRNLDDTSITATVDPAIGTLVHVAWNTHTPAEGWVEYGPDASYGFVTPLQPAATSQEVTLLGVPADSTWHYRVVTDAGEEPLASDDATFTTDPIPAEIPPLTVERHGTNQLWGEYTLFSWWSVVTEHSFAAIVNREGEVVWHWTPEWGYAVTVRLSDDGRAVYVLCAGIGADADARIVKVPLDGSATTETPTPYAHHDFFAVGDTLVYIAGEIREVDGVDILGDYLVEIDADGESREVWNAFDSWPMTEHAGFEQEPADWTHANGVGYHPESDLWLLSLYYDNAIIGISRATGDIAWQVGGLGGDFQFQGGDDGFGPQHAPSWVDGELLLFDNAYDDESSRLVQYRLDFDVMTATPTWQYLAPAGMTTRLMGDASRLPDGGSLSGWGELEEIRSVDADGTLVRTLSLDALGLVGQVQRLGDLYPVGSTFPDR